MAAPRVVVAITGASGAPYALRLLEALPEKPDLILSDAGRKVVEYETGRKPSSLTKLARRVYENEDLTAAPSSGSHKFDALVIVPCSATTFSKIALGIADNLVTRAALVCLKEHRKLIIVPRETPLAAIHLEHLAKLAALDVVVLFAAPPFYTKPRTLDDQISYIAGKILDHLGVEHKLFPRWREDKAKSE